MKRILLAGALVLGAATQMMAEFQVYYPKAGGDELPMGCVTNISPNGRYAVIGDDANFLSYLWDAKDPENMVLLNNKAYKKIIAFDVNDRGEVVADVYAGNDKHLPGLYRNGQWTLLDVPETALNTNFGYRISNDGKVIGGVCNIVDMNVETHGGYRPCRWILNEEGEYDCVPVLNIPQEVNHHQGFWMTDMSEDGEYIVGYIMCGFSQCEIPAIVKGDKYILFNEVETRYNPWQWKGKWEGRDEDGNQIWLDDVNDPRVSKYPEYYIDGYLDTNTENNVQGAFMYFDNTTNLIYGRRTVIEDVQEDGSATLLKGAMYYDIEADEFVDDRDVYAYVCAYNDAIFTGSGSMMSGGKVIEKGVTKSLGDYFGVTFGRTVSGIQSHDDAGNVFGGMWQELNPASQELDYYPVIVANTAHVAVDKVVDNAMGVNINVVNGMICVAGADNAEVYNLNGQKVAEGNFLEVANGMYVVKAGNKVVKVLVK